MSRVEIRGLKVAGKRKVSKIREAISRSGIEEYAEDIYKKSIRAGNNPKTGKKYRKLKPKTIERRKQLAKNNSTGKGYSARKANHTFTGQLIESIKAKYLTSKRVLVIDVFGQHKPPKGVRGKAVGKRVSNKKIAEGQEQIGRPLLAASKKFLKTIEKRLIKRLKKIK